MAASAQEISKWFDEMKSAGHNFMLVVCDTFDHEDYPVGFKKNARATVDKYNAESMQRVMECYDLNMDKATQMRESRAWHFGEEPIVEYGTNDAANPYVPEPEDEASVLIEEAHGYLAEFAEAYPEDTGLADLVLRMSDYMKGEEVDNV